MRRTLAAPFIGLLVTLWLLATHGSSLHSDDSAPNGHGPIVAITLETGRFADGAFVLAGRDASQQLVVTGRFAPGEVGDLTSQAEFSASPPGIVRVSSSGWVTPEREGEATILANVSGGHQATCRVLVRNLVVDLPVSFPNEVVPVFSKYGCNAGGCHGKSGGQNGFRLSLLGFEPAEDFEHLVHESRGRRLFPAAPARSLLLLKATGELPHGGGNRFDVESPPYRVLRRWIEQGMPFGSDNDPQLARIEVLPNRRTMAQESDQQVAVVAHYSDGSTRDATRIAQYESNDPELAEAKKTGLITTGKATGSVAVMVRYQTAVDVFRATVPYGAQVDDFPEPENFVDELVFRRLAELGLPASPASSDAVFLRRASVDLAGRLPTLNETEAFFEDASANKRRQLIERLVDSTDYADYFANKWAAVLRNKRSDPAKRYTTYAFYDWLRQSLLENVPYDHLAREVLAASGRVEDNPAVAWYHQVRDSSAQVEDMAQLFLGMRMQCAKCHHHPFEKWSQQDYYGLASFFSRVGRKPSKFGGGREHIFHNVGLASTRNPKTGQDVPPTPLGAEALEILADEDPRHRLVDWMTEPDNPFFARALVNRYWKHFFGRGLVDPEDDMRVTNPASNPELLDALAEHFVSNGYDLKDLVRTICVSKVYSLSSEPNQFNKSDKQNFSRFYPRRLHAEVLLDAIDTVTSSKSRFAGVPAFTRAVQLPDNAFESRFLTVFGRPEAVSACECERSSSVNLAQCLHLLNSQEIRGKVSGSRAAELARDERPHEEKLRELYLVAFCRPPTPVELNALRTHLAKYQDDAQKAYEDIIWALINTKEFLFTH